MILLVLAGITAVYLGAEVWVGLLDPPAVQFAGFVASVGADGLVVAAVTETAADGGPTPAAAAGLRPGDRLVAVVEPDGEQVRFSGLLMWAEVVRELEDREMWPFVVERGRADGTVEEVVLELPRPRETGARTGTWLPIVLALVAAGTGLLIGFLRPDSGLALTACLLFLGFSSLFTQSGFFFPPGLREGLLVWQSVLNLMVPYLFLRFFMRFPSRSWLDRRIPWLLPVALLIAVAHVVVNLYGVALLSVSLDALDRFMDSAWETIASGLGITQLGFVALGLLSLVLNTVRAEGPDERRRMRVLLTGTVVGIVPVVVLVVITVLQQLEIRAWLVLVCLATAMMFPLSFAYAVTTHRALRIRVIIRRGLQYALVSRGFVAAEAVILFAVFFLLARPLFERLFAGRETAPVMLAAAAVTLGVVALLRRVNPPVMRAIDRRFFREAYDAEQVLSSLADDIRATATRPRELLAVLAETVGGTLNIDLVSIFLRSPVGPPWRDLEIVEPGRYVCCHLWAHPRSGRERPDAEDLWIGPGSHLASAVNRCDPERPAVLDVGPTRRDERPLWTMVGDDTGDLRMKEELNLRLVVPLASGDRILGFLGLGEKLSGEGYTGHDSSMLLGVAGQAAVAVDYAGMIVAAAARERLEHEVRLARTVQRSLIPADPPAISGYVVAQLLLPAREAAGDFFQYYRGSDGDVLVLMGDVAGKGLHASMLVALTLGAAGALVADGDRPEGLLRRLNDLLCRQAVRRSLVTCCVARLRPSTGRVVLATAGHPYPLLRGSDGSWCELPGPEPRLPLGVRAAVAYRAHEARIERGGTLLLMSDGVTESRSPGGEPFGDVRLRAVLRGAPPGADLPSALVDAVRRHCGDHPPQDDISVVSISRRSRDA